jgi:hypothetical protein
MQRVGTDLLVTVAASIVMATAVLLVGAVGFQQPPARLDDWPTGGASACHELAVTALAASTVEGRGRLCLDDGRVRAGLQLGGLTPSHAYTAWLAYFDRPATCSQAPCGVVDLRGEDPSGVLGRIGGGVPIHTHALNLQADFHNLVLAPGAQVTLLLLNHGPASMADGRARARQLLTAETPDFGGPAFGAFEDGRRAFPHGQASFVVPGVVPVGSALPLAP